MNDKIHLPFYLTYKISLCDYTHVRDFLRGKFLLFSRGLMNVMSEKRFDQDVNETDPVITSTIIQQLPLKA